MRCCRQRRGYGDSFSETAGTAAQWNKRLIERNHQKKHTYETAFRQPFGRITLDWERDKARLDEMANLMLLLL